MQSIKQFWNNLKYWRHYLWIFYRFSDYKPQPVTIRGITKWLNQFEQKDRKIILKLLSKIRYLSEKETEAIIVDLNVRLLERLKSNGIPLKNIVYIQTHDPGSSGAVMMSMLRDRGRLEGKGCHFIDSRNIRGISETTSKLEQGAIIYVDDFSASGDQFSEVRSYLAQYIIGNFSEFFLLPTICEEAHYQLGKMGVEAMTKIIHAKADRPLHHNSSLLDNASKDRLIEICNKIDKKGALGYRGLATMIVYYRNTPNTVPVIIRGCIRQDPWAGILPRTTDLP